MGVIIAVYALIILGILLCFFGKFPGQILAYAGLLTAAFALKNQVYPIWLLVLCGVLVIASIIVNMVFAPKLAAKVHEFGKAGKWGTIVGSILSLFVLAAVQNGYVALAVFIIMPFALAFLFELISKKNAGEAAKRATGAYVQFAVTTFINLLVAVFCASQVLFGWIGNGKIGKEVRNAIRESKDVPVQTGSSYILSILNPDTYYYDDSVKSEEESQAVVDSKKDEQNDELAKQQAELDALKAELESMKAQQAENANNKLLTTYVGTISGKYAIHMDLTFIGDNVEGSYYYGDGANGSLTLTGWKEIDPEAGVYKLTLNETNSKGESTGQFVGLLDGMSYYGTFTNLKTGKQSEFSVDM